MKRFKLYKSFNYIINISQILHFLWEFINSFGAEFKSNFILILRFFWKDTVFFCIYHILLNCPLLTYLKKNRTVIFIFFLIIIDDLIFSIPCASFDDISSANLPTETILGQASKLKCFYFSLHLKLLFFIFFTLSRVICLVQQPKRINVPRSKRFYIRKRYKGCRRNKIVMQNKILLLALLLAANNSSTIQPHNFHEVLYYEICFSVSKKISFENNSSYSWLLLLLCNDVERNPGPIHQHNYSFGHPYLCGFYRIALLDMLNNILIFLN